MSCKSIVIQSIVGVVVAAVVIGSALPAAAQRPDPEVDLIVQTGRQLQDAGQYAKAADEYEKALARDGSRQDALHYLGECYRQLGKYDDAAKAYKRALKHRPGDEDLLKYLGYYQMRSKDVEGAKDTYNELLRLDPGAFEPNRWLGYINEKSGNYDQALKYYEAALMARPGEVSVMGSIAKIYREQGETEKALAMFERAIPNAPEADQAGLKDELGKLYIGEEQFQKAAQLYADLVQVFPDKHTYRYNLGISYMKMEHPDMAIAQLEKAVEIKTDFCDAYVQLAAACNDAGQPGKALTTSDNALGKCPDNKAALYYQKGRALEGQKRYDEAILVFEMAQNDPFWGPYAKQQIQRQMELIKRAEIMKNQ